MKHPAFLRLSLLWVVFLFWGTTAQAETIFVSPAGVLFGNGAGTLEKPWQTPQLALQEAYPGDTVVLLPGVYKNTFFTRRNGLSDKMITIKGENALLAASLIVTNNYIRVASLSITGTVVIGRTASHNLIESNFVSNGTYLAVLDGEQPAQTNGASFNIVRGNCFSNSTSAMMILNGTSNVIEGNRFEKSNGNDCIRMWGVGHLIRGNTFYDISTNPTNNQHTDVFQTYGDNKGDCYNIIFERNLVLNCNGQLCNLTQDNMPNIRDLIIRNNIIAYGFGQANIYIPGTRWYNNVFYRNAANQPLQFRYGDGTIGASHNTVVANNFFVECGVPSSEPNYGFYYIDYRATNCFSDYNFFTGTNQTRKNIDQPHSINGADPMFVNTEALDFRLREGSPAINAGVWVEGLTDDKNGADRTTKPGVDIGAYLFPEIPANQPPK